MEFNEFWEKVKNYLTQGIELETITKSGFKANFDRDAGVIVVTPKSTMLPRDINKGDFRNVYNKMKDLSRKQLDIYRPALYQRLTRNSSYILPIIKEVQTYGGKQKTLDKSKK